jgi:hypothetical protein
MVEMRPSIRRLIRVVLPLVIVVAAWQVWANVEAARLRRIVDRLDPDERRQQAGSDNDAARLYLAAAIASADLHASAVPARAALDVIRRRRDAMINGTPLRSEDHEAWATMRAQGALPAMLLEQASTLPFVAFGPGTEFNFRASGLINAGRLAEASTLVAIDADDREAAIMSIVARLQFLRAFNESAFLLTQRAALAQHIAADLTLLSRRGSESDAQLASLDEAWARLYEDSDFARALNGFAYGQLDFLAAGLGTRGRPAVVQRLVAPMFTREAVRQLEALAEALRISKQPWPERLRGLTQITDPSPSFSVRALAHNLGIAVASFAATARTTRAALAIERYRRRHGRLPASLNDIGMPAADLEDPFSGQPLIFRVSPNEFVVYSAGADGRDDGGRFEMEPAKGRAPGLGPLLDIGVRRKTDRAT